MRQIKYRTYTFELTEKRTYHVVGSGTSAFEAEQDAIARFHRLCKSGDLVASEVSRPKVVTHTLEK